MLRGTLRNQTGEYSLKTARKTHLGRHLVIDFTKILLNHIPPFRVYLGEGHGDMGLGGHGVRGHIGSGRTRG